MQIKYCKVPGCDRRCHGKGYCTGHYQRVVKGKSTDAPLRAQYDQDECAAEGCENPRHARGWCTTHYFRVMKFGSPDLPEREPKAPTSRVTRFGYRVIYLPCHPMANSSGVVAEHRLVMSAIIGRELLPTENVHHVNGDRLDNSPGNLELWSTSQPSGQRVEDKITWALEFLRLHRPDALQEGTP